MILGSLFTGSVVVLLVSLVFQNSRMCLRLDGGFSWSELRGYAEEGEGPGMEGLACFAKEKNS